MTIVRAPEREKAPINPSSSGLFRAFWRWHFYASFLVVPLLLLLAVTGLIYLFRFQLEPMLNAQMSATASAELRQPYAAQQAAVQEAYPDATVLMMAEGRTEERATSFTVIEADGSTRDVFVDPWTAKVTGSLNPDTTLSGYAVRLHGDLMSGKKGDALIELAACWAIVMALTGYYLFFRGWRARKRRLASKVPGAKLRSRHGVIGAVTGIGLLFLLVSGLPWTGFWGEKVQQLATNQGTSLWSLDPGAESTPGSVLDESLPHSHAHEVPWGAGKSEVPESEGNQSEGHGTVADLDTAVAVAEREGLKHPLTVALPDGEGGVFSAIGYAFHDPSQEKTVHIDQFGGQVVATYGYDDYPALAKIVTQGIGLHEGRSLGLVSFWGSALMCAFVIASCITGPFMWWRRRPKKAANLGAPRGKMPMRATPWLMVRARGLGDGFAAVWRFPDRDLPARSARRTPGPGAEPMVRHRERGLEVRESR